MNDPASAPDPRPSASLLTVVMAVHDGARFLPAQLASIRAQSFRDFVLLARDDGSRDGSWAILSAAAAEDPRVRPSRVARARGAVAAFAALLAEVRTPYFALCDQDDVWHPEHLRRAIEALEAAPEADLTHTDLELVDEEGRPLGERLWTRLGLKPVRRRPSSLLVRNTVTGAAAVGRTRLLERALPIPENAPMHDWWLALAAASGGGILPRDEPTVFYRQHPAQLLGARARGWALLPYLHARGLTLAQYLRRWRKQKIDFHEEALRRFAPLRRWRILLRLEREPWVLRVLTAPLYALLLALAAPEAGLRRILTDTLVEILPLWIP